MTIEELKERTKSVLDASLDGIVHSDLENILSEVIADYEAFLAAENGGEWEAKYNELKQKYIDRFLNGEPDEQEESVPDAQEEEAAGEDITIEDLIKED